MWAVTLSTGSHLRVKINGAAFCVLHSTERLVPNGRALPRASVKAGYKLRLQGMKFATILTVKPMENLIG